MKSKLRRIEQALYENENSLKWMKVADPAFQHAGYLVNHDRETLLVWHRSKGPEYIIALMKHLEDSSYQLPMEIDGVSRESLLFQMSNILQEKGTPRLKKFIDSYALTIMEYARNYNSLYKLLHDLGISLNNMNDSHE